MISRIAPLVVAITAGLLVLADFFIDTAVVDALGLYLIRTASVVTAFALILGLTNVATVHFRKIVNRDKSWGYSVVLLGALAFTLTAGFLTGGPGSALMRRVFDSVLFPLEATIFSLLAFFLVAAVYRAFRVKSFESGLFVVFGIIVLLGQVPVGALLWDQLPIIKDWVLDVPALAGMRGILLGVGLGTAATGMRVLMGIDRPYAE